MSVRTADVFERRFGFRKGVNRLMVGLIWAAAAITVIPLFYILFYIFIQGVSALDLSFLTELPKPVGETGGGIANAIVGTCILVALGSLIGIPWGVAIGVFLSEYRTSRVASTVRFANDLLASVPSIILGLFAYAIVVVPLRHFSAYAGGLALSLIMIPTVAKTTEELLKMVPDHIREAGLGLGLPRWRVILFIVLRGSRYGIVTGILLAVARISGETAPLLFTAFNNRFWSFDLGKPMASLPIQIYNYAISPYEDWHQQAWAGALILVSVILVINIATRVLLRPRGNQSRV